MSKPILRIEFFGSDDGVRAVIATADVDIEETGAHVIEAGKKALKTLGDKALRFGLARCMGQLTLDLGDGEVVDLAAAKKTDEKKGAPKA